MFEDTKGNGGSANGGGGGGSLAGYATQAWVNEGFVSIEFFNRLFTVYGPGETSSDPDVVVEPNDLDSTIKNIKAMFGLWTEQYLSALGLNPGGTGSATSLGMLDDVDITTPTNGQALVYNATSLKWENETISTVTALANLTDVLLTSPANGQTLLYDGTNAKWYNSALKTINGQSLLGSGDISVGGGASGKYLPLSGGTLVLQYAYIYLDSPLIQIKTLSNTNIVRIGSGTSDPSSGREYGWLAIYHNNQLNSQIYAHPSGDSWVCNGSRNFGIGTDAPKYKLDVRGNISFGTPGSYGIIGCQYSANDTTFGNYIKMYSSGSNGSIEYAAALWTSTTSEIAHIFKTYISNNSFVILNNGYIGLNTTPVSWFHSKSEYAQLIHTNYQLKLTTSQQNIIASLGSGSSTPDGYGTYGILQLYHNNIEMIRIYTDGNSYINNNYNFGIGTSNAYYKLHVVGSIYATGGITALSDIKQKNVEQYDAHLGFDDVANAPIIKFTWKDPKAEDKGLQVGSVAQYWEKVLPEAVKKDKEGTLSMSYGVVALVAAVSTAKKVQEHERRIADLERENRELKERLKIE